MSPSLASEKTTGPAKSRASSAVLDEVCVDRFTDGLLDPSRPMLGPVRDGGRIVAQTTPGCWGPMITPTIRGGHEVTQPVAVAGAAHATGVARRRRRLDLSSVR